jgi:hypothetical protein
MIIITKFLILLKSLSISEKKLTLPAQKSRRKCRGANVPIMPRITPKLFLSAGFDYRMYRMLQNFFGLQNRFTSAAAAKQ